MSVTYKGVEYEVGDRVRLVWWAPSKLIDDSKNVPPGTEGTVQGGSAGLYGPAQLWVQWDNGSHLAPTSPDHVERITNV